MKKIPSLFQRNYDGDRLVRNEVSPGCEWVINGEGRATVKWDGSCCMIRDGKFYKRREVRVKDRTKMPVDFEEVDYDANTNKAFGWVPVGDGPEDQWHREAFVPMADGTYELMGPKVQGNPENLGHHVLVRHGEMVVEDAPRDFDALKLWFKDRTIEGLVWHHDDGRMVKIKRRDFYASGRDFYASE